MHNMERLARRTMEQPRCKSLVLNNRHREKGIDPRDSWSNLGKAGGKGIFIWCPGRFPVGDVTSGIDFLLWPLNSKGCYNKYPR